MALLYTWVCVVQIPYSTRWSLNWSQHTLHCTEWLDISSIRCCCNLLTCESGRISRLESTWAFQVGSSQCVVASPYKFSGVVVQCTSHSKSTWKVDLSYKLAPSRSLISEMTKTSTEGINYVMRCVRKLIILCIRSNDSTRNQQQVQKIADNG